MNAAMGVPPGRVTVAAVRRRLIRRRIREATGVLAAVVVAVAGLTAAVRVYGTGPGPAAHPAPATVYVAYVPPTGPVKKFDIVPIRTATGKAGATIRIPCSCVFAATPDGKTLYVATGSAIIPVSTATNTPGKPINISSGAEEIAINPDGKTAYAFSEGLNRITPISTATNRPGRPIHVRAPSMIAFAPDGKTAYVFDNSSPVAVTPVNLVTNTPGTPIPVVSSADAMTITPNGKTVYVAGQKGITPINTATKTAGPLIPVQFAGVMAVTPNGKTLYAGISLGRKVTVVPISTATNTPGRPIRVAAAEELVITPNGKTVYVASTEANPLITPISTATNTPGKPINAGYPVIAVTPDGKTLYAATTGKVIPISTATNTPGTPIKVLHQTAFGMVIAP